METNRRITRSDYQKIPSIFNRIIKGNEGGGTMQSGVCLRVLLLAAFTVTITAQKPAPEVFTLTVPNGPILTRLNASVTLPCELSPLFNVEPLEVRWYRSENSNSPALLYKDHKIQEAPVDPRYRGRVSLTGGLERGNVSLTLERVTLEDRGEYVCHVSNERWYEKANVYLSMNVTGSAPVLSVASGGGGQVNVTCSSEGWSPQPKLTWRNKEGTEIKNEQVLFTSDSQGLLSVSSWLLYSPSDSDWLSCTISLSEEEKRESRVLPHKPGAWKEAFIVTLVLSLLLLCALSTVVCILLKHRDQIKLEQSKSETKKLFKVTENSQEKQPVKDGINLQDWRQVKGFQENITMNEKTAHSAIRVTQEGKTAQYINENMKSSDRRHPHVLANQSFESEQHYWEVKVRDETFAKAVGDCRKLSWYVGVARDNADRTSTVPVTAHYGFWILSYEEGKGFHVNTDPLTSEPVREDLSVVGVFLDCDKHSLSFYNVDTESHIYTFCNLVTSYSFCPVFSPGQHDLHPITILNEN
ncbi:butyrophilin subfamily 2 member A2 isoform X3 [Salmo salar]|uniref:Butyrophilin subfamily 2 member A2 isoform X3 n=1 Tax=Salmo salar TaxID=8030 RepID=A0A1S3RGE5_SALSA|nr:butyrophilin subfamily 2 member A2-like isoform X3 [Salmo salar]|eukprot:XP_014050922.1 PREDICTED: butyrophilin subfamily 2 member A2-like isoform X3 [Salmo salar]